MKLCKSISKRKISCSLSYVPEFIYIKNIKFINKSVKCIHKFSNITSNNLLLEACSENMLPVALRCAKSDLGNMQSVQNTRIK